MAEEFNASVVISTTEAVTGLKAVDDAAKNLDVTLKSLDQTIRANQGDLTAVASKMNELVRSNKALIDSDIARAKATTEAAKADALVVKAQGDRQKAADATAIAEAKVAKIQQSSTASGLSSAATSARQDAVARAAIDDRATIAAQRLATETERTGTQSLRTAAAQATLEGATARSELAQLRLANAQERTNNSNLRLNDSLSNSRYLLYDVGQTYGVLSAALLAIPTATAAVAIAYEKDFAQVIRTNNELNDTQFGALRQELKDLATQIPLTFEQFSSIATMAGQLGIAGNEVGAFTETVARFGAASNVSLDEAGTAFGRLQDSFNQSNDIPDFFNKVGSSIAEVGVKSVATESQIIAVTNQISATGAQFGFTADQVVGLSGALASVRIRPEMARGAFQRILLGLSSAADQGTQSFDRFAKYTGVVGDAAINLFKTDPSAFFYKYIGGVKDAIAATGSVSSVLSDIGAKNVFDKQFILGLANGYDVFGQSLQNASSAFADGTFLKSSTQGVFETLDAKIKRIGDSIQNLGDTFAKGDLGPNGGLGKIADTVLSISQATDRFARATPAFTAFVNVLLSLGTAVGILLAFKSAQAFVLAGLVGFQQVLGKTSIAAGLTLKGNLQELAKTMLMVKGVNAEVAESFVVSSGAMKAFGTAALLTKEQVLAANAGTATLGDTVERTGGRFGGLITGAKGVGSALLGMVGGPIGASIIALGFLATAWISAKNEADNAGEAMARAATNGADALKAATVDALAAMKVGADAGFAAIGNLDKSLTQVSQDAGVKFEDVAAAALKGKDAGKAILDVLNEVAKSKGFGSFAEASKSLDPATVEWLKSASIIKTKVTEAGNSYVTAGSNAKVLADAHTALGDSAAKATTALDANGNAIDANGTSAKDAKKEIDDFVSSLFGIVDAQSATQDALSKLGDGLYKSLDMSAFTEGGRANLKAYQDAIKNAALEQQQLVDSGQQTIEQASSNYGQFIDDLNNQLAQKGVNVDQIAAIAQQAKGVFASQLKDGNDPTLQVKVDASQVDAAKAYLDSIVAVYGTTNLDVILRAGGTEQTVQNVSDVQQYVQSATGTPYTFVANADTSNANENINNTFTFASAVLGPPITMTVQANTDPATQALQALAQYAAGVVNQIIDAFNGFHKGFNGIFGVGADDIGHVGWGAAPAPVPRAAPAVAARPANIPSQAAAKPLPAASSQAQIDQNNANKSSLGGLADGYDKAADAANKAGAAGNKAGKDAANGIGDAAAAAADYASRLKQGLTSAYDQQYALTKTTDDYHAALNAVAKKRQDDLSALDDAILKQKTLNDERDSSLIDAKKAGTEKNISLKYGETARAEDYANQEQKALDAAAAKQKDIDANNKTITSLKAGIDNFNGYSDAAIANRQALRDLESKMLDMVSAYAATGASQEQVRAYATKLTAQFKVDAGQVWNNRVQIDGLVGDMGRYIGVINAVPMVKPTTVTANTGGASGALGGIQSQLNQIGQGAVATVRWQYTGETIQMDNYTVANGQPVWRVVNQYGENTGKKFFNKGGQVQGFADGGLIPGQSPSDPSVDNMMATVDGRGLVKVRSGEFIVQQPAVDFWGLDFFKQLNNMKMPQFNSGGQIGGGNGSSQNKGGAVLVELTADNIAAILRLADRPVDLYANVEKIASTVNEGNRILASKGVVH